MQFYTVMRFCACKRTEIVPESCAPKEVDSIMRFVQQTAYSRHYRSVMIKPRLAQPSRRTLLTLDRSLKSVDDASLAAEVKHLTNSDGAAVLGAKVKEPLGSKDL